MLNEGTKNIINNTALTRLVRRKVNNLYKRSENTDLEKQS